eukprot:scaffold2767_cov177-Amphora_coffeaeformis.AAC.91
MANTLIFAILRSKYRRLVGDLTLDPLKTCTGRARTIVYNYITKSSVAVNGSSTDGKRRHPSSSVATDELAEDDVDGGCVCLSGCKQH